MDRADLKLIVIALVIAGIIGGAWYFRDRVPVPAEPMAPTETPSPLAPRETGEPLHPLDLPDMDDSGSRELVPLPALDDSDSYFLLALTDLFGSDIETILANEALIDRFVATVDNLTRSHVAERIRPAGSLPGSLVVDPGDVEGQYVLSPDNYRRYDSLISLIASTDPDSIVATYRRFYPLLQEAYERLGYPNAYFNDRVVEVIDHLLVAPQPEEPVRLARPHVLYEFVDPELQGLSSGRKLLIRVGPDNAATIKVLLQRIRDQLASS